MNTTIRKTTIARLYEAKALIQAYPRRAIAACVGVVILVGMLSLFDWSDRLNSEQVNAVRAFVVRTNAEPVRGQFNQEVKSGHLTVRGTERIIEVAKEQDPGYGLITDQKNNK
ncbi:hypothetical protein [Chromobacterium haemolyticum]|uniref:hypothetical protein n=1 Tax=Chromobacterium haemolyticum TaxID=394935 RepID=UPI0024482FF9|nr:hypothetical protein [Chromobacterium haemolyticum]MDH0342149.1 hypothetical protein [Chromobacterium haemolyticum]